MICFGFKTGLIAGLMIVLYRFQDIVLTHFNIDISVSLFYVPAGVITMSTLVSPVAGPIGIFMGTLFINFQKWPDIPAVDTILLSAIPSIGAVTAVIILYSFKSKLEDVFRQNKELPEIDAIDVFYFCSTYGVINAVAHQALYFSIPAFGVDATLSKAIGMWFGDLTGSFLVFIALNFGYIAWTRIKQRRS